MQDDENVKKKLKLKSFALLARKSYFTKELEGKLLEKGFPKKEITALLAELKERGWLNDHELATRFVERQKAKGYGPKLIALKLREKAGSIEVEIEESEDSLRSVIQKKYAKMADKKKVIAALLRRGFSYELIKRHLEDM